MRTYLLRYRDSFSSLGSRGLVRISHSDDTSDDRRMLPNGYVGLDTQIDILRGLTASYSRNRRALGYRDIASLVGVSPENVSRCFKFWKSTGLIEEVSRGAYQPSEALIRFDFSGDSERLPESLANTWFGDVVLTALSFKGSMNEGEIKAAISGEYAIRNHDRPSDKSLSYALGILLRTGALEESDGAFKARSAARPHEATDRGTDVRIDEDSDFVTIVIANKKYAVERTELLAFVRERGKSLSEEVDLG